MIQSSYQHFSILFLPFLTTLLATPQELLLLRVLFIASQELRYLSILASIYCKSSEPTLDLKLQLCTDLFSGEKERMNVPEFSNGKVPLSISQLETRALIINEVCVFQNISACSLHAFILQRYNGAIAI